METGGNHGSGKKAGLERMHHVRGTPKGRENARIHVQHGIKGVAPNRNNKGCLEGRCLGKGK